MKEYVLDLAPPRQAEPVAEPELEIGPPATRSSWRSIVLLIVLGAPTLALLYVALIGLPGTSEASIQTAVASDPTIASARSMPAPAPTPTQAQPQHAEGQPAQVDGVAQEAQGVPSRITHEHGRYVIELHSTAIGPALDMLTKATGATVRGSDVLAGNTARITRIVVTDSALEAWQAVFGGVANFAATCSHGGCAVSFVSSTALTPTAMVARLPSPVPAPTPAPAVQAGDEPQPD